MVVKERRRHCRRRLVFIADSVVPTARCGGPLFLVCGGFWAGCVPVICACSRKLSAAADGAFFCREQELAATRFARIISPASPDR